MNILEVQNVTKRFGGLVAVSGIDLVLPEGMIASIIGPNGAGKTTLFNVFTGIYKPEAGAVMFAGTPTVGRRSDQITALGLARTFQNIRLFNNMSVIENVLVGMHTRLHQTGIDALLRSRRFKQEEAEAHERARDLLAFVGLHEVDNEIAKNLPYGAQRRIEIARALAAEPKLILLDEPTAGMNPQETQDAMALFRRLRDDKGITVLLIEHDMRVVMGISERITVLDYGEKIAEGTPEQVRANVRVVEAYLGRSAVEAAAA